MSKMYSVAGLLLMAAALGAAGDAFGSPMKTTCEPCYTPSEEIPVTSGGLSKASQVQTGGACLVFWKLCSAASFDYLDKDEWQASINAGETIAFFCNLKLGLATEATQRGVGCSNANLTTNRTHTVTITDIFDTPTADHAKFYEFLQENPSAFQLAYVTSAGKFYPPVAGVANPLRTTEEDADGVDQVVTTFEYRRLITPVPTAVSWTSADFTLPSCTARINVLVAAAPNYTLQVVPTLSAGATAVTGYVWKVDGVVEALATASSYAFTGLASGEVITCEVTDNAPVPCTSVGTYTVP
jgi:hypothetical protein